MTTAERTKKLETVAKLFALADRESGATEPEALLAMERARSLMDDYNLSLSDVQNVADEPAMEAGETEVSAGVRIPYWRSILAQAVAALTETFVIQARSESRFDDRGYYAGGRVFRFIGERRDVALAASLYPILEATVEAAARSRGIRGRVAARCYREGFTSKLYDRAKVKGAKQSAEQRATTAIVLRGKDALTKAYVTQKYPHIRSASRGATQHDHAAYQAGQHDGERASLSARRAIT